MQKLIGLVLLLAIIGGAVAFRVYYKPTAAMLALATKRIEKEIALLNLREEEQRGENAVRMARLAREQQLAESQAVSSAAVVNAVFVRILPVLSFTAAAIGGLVYAFTRRVKIESPITGVFPRKDAFRLASMALQVQQAEAAARVMALQEDTTRQRMNDAGNFFKSLKGITGRENVTINNALPEHAETQQQAGNVPFQQAVRDFRAGSVLLGYSDKPEYMPIDSFVSCAFGGGSGSGKTSKLRFLLAQLILDGVNVSILDAHAGNEQSLADSLGNLANMPNVRIFNPFETAQAVKTMLAEVQAAIDAGTPADVPYVYVLDELRPLNRACEDVETLMDKIANEGRKYDRFMIASSQTWEAKMFKQAGSAARDACVLKMAAKMPKEQARTLFKDGESARTVAKLARPEMYADSMLFNGVVTVPFCSKEDCDTLAAKYSKTNARQAIRQEIDVDAIEETRDDENTAEVKIDGVSNVIPFPGKRVDKPVDEQPLTKAVDTLSDAETLETLRNVMTVNSLSLGEVSRQTGVDKGLLSRILNGKQALTVNVKAAILPLTTGKPTNQTREA